MEPHRHDEGMRIKAIERYDARLAHHPDLQKNALDEEARARVSAQESSIRCLAAACEIYADRPSLAERAHVVEEGRLRYLSSLRHLTYAELWARVQAFASGLGHLGLVAPGELVGLCGFGSVDWTVADLACLYTGAVSVPLRTTAPPAELGRIIAEAELSSIVCSMEQLDLVAASITAAPSVRSIVVMDLRAEDREQREAFALAEQRLVEERPRVTIFRLDEVTRAGRERGVVPFFEHGASDDPLRTIVYTSGSTGSPKGAMFPESVWRQYWQSPFHGDVPSIASVTVSYMPLNHMAGRGTLVRTLADGGSLSFVLASDMSTLFEDIRIARPTWLLLVPRAANMIHQHFLTEVVRARASEDEVMESMRRSFLGDRLVYAVTGSAPTAPEVFSFLERCFEIPVYEGYGTTEAGPITFEGRISHDNVTAFKLVDVPELGYLRTDQPYPRGELCITARRMIPGYYKNPEATHGLFDAEGYLCTGDVVEQRGPDEVAWIDRKKNVLKLSQGEFVSISRLEEAFAAGSPLIRQVYLYGTSLRSYLLAVVVPDGRADKATLLAELRKVATREGLRGYEIPRDIIVETEPFTQDNGLLTESAKPARAKLAARYRAELEALYQAMEKAEREALRTVGRGEDKDLPVEAKIARALAVDLGLPKDEAIDTSQSFLSLGGDSLGATRVAALIEELTGVAVPVGLVLDPTSSVRTLARYVEGRLGPEGAPRRASFESVHRAGAATVQATDLRVDRFMSGDELSAAFTSPVPGAARSQVVLLTGANGFLGRFLLLELLERAAREGGRVHALVRAPGEAAALERLAASYRGPDQALAEQLATLSAGGRLVIEAGDLMQPGFGLSAERWDRLAGEVDTIVHAGALVNHAFSYEELFEPNVLGTVEVMRLALLRRRKAISFVSSVGVVSGLDRASPVREDEDGEALFRERPVDHGYAVGYATSKWAGEVLLRDLSRRVGGSISVFRCSMIMPPRAFAGQVNAGDFLTRLFQSVVHTGTAPPSFYADEIASPRFDGLPVDFVAHAIAAVATEPRPGYATYHVTSGAEGTASLDAMVDWIASAGYRVTREGDHAAWFRKFRERLEALRPEDRQRSVLPILQQWEEPLRRDLRFDNQSLVARLSALAGGATIEVPPIDEALVHRYLEAMADRGLVPRPAARAAAA